MASPLRKAYDQAVQSGRLRPDPAQAHALEALIRLERDLSASSRRRLFRKPQAVQGVYLYGPVGRGKSMLMDLFYETATAPGKRRVHFHVFMAEVHRLIGRWRAGDDAERKSVFGTARGDDPIGPTAGVIAEASPLLCFDEFQVSDIADAMILGRLFQALLARGVTITATSNRAPDTLYLNGINRQLFLPFIDMLKTHLQIVAVKGAVDYRLDRLCGEEVWLHPPDDIHEAQFNALWATLLDGAEESGITLEVLGRKTHLPRAAGGLVRASFASLCGQALGPQDYLALAERSHTLFLEGVPLLGSAQRSEARRFVTLIDALYEARVKLVSLAAAAPEAIYPEGEGAFEFQRCVSRLQEMRSADYLATARD
jgi:cell division protein ZapE